MPAMTHALPPLTQATIEAFAASALAWAMRLVRLLFTPGAERRARSLDRLVARLERRVECILFLKAALRLGPVPRRLRRPGSLAPGFRRTRGSLRHLLKSARVRAKNATPIARLARLLAALADSAAYVAHFMRRLARGLHFGAIVACAPPAAALSADPAHACAFADSS
jgi:hypothetical protein